MLSYEGKKDNIHFNQKLSQTMLITKIYDDMTFLVS